MDKKESEAFLVTCGDPISTSSATCISTSRWHTRYYAMILLYIMPWSYCILCCDPTVYALSISFTYFSIFIFYFHFHLHQFSSCPLINENKQSGCWFPRGAMGADLFLHGHDRLSNNKHGHIPCCGHLRVPKHWVSRESNDLLFSDYAAYICKAKVGA